MDIVEQLKSKEINVVEFLQSQDTEAIRDRILARVPDDLDKSQGSFIWDSIEPTDIEFMVAYFSLLQVIELIDPRTSFGAWLEGQAAGHGVYKLLATKATGELYVTGEKGTIIPVGTKFSSTIPAGSGQSAKYYTSTADRTIGSSGSTMVPVIADEAGVIGNAVADEINLNASGIKKIVSVTNPTPITNGTDDETDDHLRLRWQEKMRNPDGGGNKADYCRWAKEVPGVGDAFCTPLWNGPGTVKVTISGMKGEPIPDIVDKVKNYIDPVPGMGEGKAPIGAVLTVTTVVSRPITITIPGLVLDSGYSLEPVKENIRAALDIYIAGVSGVVRVKDAESAINAVPGVLDFKSVLLDGHSENISIKGEEKAIVREVVYT